MKSAERDVKQRVAGGGVDRVRFEDDEGARSLVVDAGHRARGGDGAVGRRGAVHLDGLLAVDEHGRVEGAERRPTGPAEADDGGEGGEDLLGHLGRVLGGVLELVAGGIEGPGAHPQGVEEAVGRRPGTGDRLRGRSDGIEVHGHGVLLWGSSRWVTSLLLHQIMLQSSDGFESGTGRGPATGDVQPDGGPAGPPGRDDDPEHPGLSDPGAAPPPDAAADGPGSTARSTSTGCGPSSGSRAGLLPGGDRRALRGLGTRG